MDPGTGVTTPTTYLPGQIGSGPIGLAFDSTGVCLSAKSGTTR